jgi:hypothetical protein
MTKDELIEKHREFNVDGEWWHESVYEWFDEQCEERGIQISTTPRNHYRRGIVESVRERVITWSGFWSQGDGAAFAGRVVDFKLALGCLYDDYPIFRKYVEDLKGYIRMSWVLGKGNNVAWPSLAMEPIRLYLEDDHPLAVVWQEELDKEVDMVEALIVDVVDDLCDLLYKALRDEYDALTSDEAVWDAIQANDLDKEAA